MMDSGLQKMGELTTAFQVPAQPQPPAADDLEESIVVPTFHLVNLTGPGLYHLDIYIDDKHCGSVPFAVAEAPPPD